MKTLLPLLMLCACAGETPTCDGGGALFATLGQELDAGFESYQDGDGIPLVDQAGQVALRLDYELGGLDTTRALTMVVRLSIDGGATEDFLASVNARCVEGEAATHSAWAAPTNGLLAGQSVRLQSVFTDMNASTAESDLTLVAVDGRSSATR